MPTITRLTSGQLLQLANTNFPPDEDPDLFDLALSLFNRWINRNDHVAVYVNQDFGHPAFGYAKFVSYGSSEAQLEVERAEDLPTTLPDIGGDINWRYTLEGVYEGGAL